MSYYSDVAFIITGDDEKLRELLGFIKRAELTKEVNDRIKRLGSVGYAMDDLQHAHDTIVSGVELADGEIRFFEECIKWGNEADMLFRWIMDRAENMGLSVLFRRLGENADDFDEMFAGNDVPYERLDYARCLLPAWVESCALISEADVKAAAISIANERGYREFLIPASEQKAIAQKAIAEARRLIRDMTVQYLATHQ